MGDYDICTECAHRREDHRGDYDKPCCGACLKDVGMDGSWEDDERREGIFHPFGLLDPTWEDDCWHPKCGVCAERRARRELLQGLFEAVDSGFRSFTMVRDLFDESSKTGSKVTYLAQEVLFRIDDLRCAIEAELDDV